MKKLCWRRLTLALTWFGFIFLTGFDEVQLKDIESAVIQEDYRTAERLARSYIDQKPRSTEADPARYYLGLSLLFQDNERDARTVFEKISGQYSSDILQDKARIGIIDSFILEGDYETALNRAQDFLVKGSSSKFKSLIYLKIARCYLRLTRWDEARDYLNRIIAEYPDSLEAHRAHQLLNEKQFFAVQVGSFLDRGRAEKLIQQLNYNGEYAYMIETIDQTGQTFYRVRIGRFSRLSEARSQEKRLSELGYPTLIYP